jgi:hypothetical protein
MKTWKKPTVKTITSEELEKIIISSACSEYSIKCYMFLAGSAPEDIG